MLPTSQPRKAQTHKSHRGISDVSRVPSGTPLKTPSQTQSPKPQAPRAGASLTYRASHRAPPRPSAVSSFSATASRRQRRSSSCASPPPMSLPCPTFSRRLPLAHVWCLTRGERLWFAVWGFLGAVCRAWTPASSSPAPEVLLDLRGIQNTSTLFVSSLSRRRMSILALFITFWGAIAGVHWSCLALRSSSHRLCSHPDQVHDDYVGSGRGMLVCGIYEGGSAYWSDLKLSDIITTVDGIPVLNASPQVGTSDSLHGANDARPIMRVSNPQLRR